MKDDKIIKVSPDGTYGINIESDRLNVSVYTRKIYLEDTQVSYKVNGAIEYKFYKSGDYGPWVLAARPHKSSIESALLWIHELMLMDHLDGADDIKCLAETVKSSKSQLSEILLSSVMGQLVESVKSSPPMMKKLIPDLESGQTKTEPITTSGSVQSAPAT